MMALGIFYPLLLLSGIVWPIQGIPVALRWVVMWLLTDFCSCRSKVYSIGRVELHPLPLHIISLNFPSILKPPPSPLSVFLFYSLLILCSPFFLSLSHYFFLFPSLYFLPSFSSISLPSPNIFSHSFSSLSSSSTFFPPLPYLSSSLYILPLRLPFSFHSILPLLSPTILILFYLPLSFSYLF